MPFDEYRVNSAEEGKSEMPMRCRVGQDFGEFCEGYGIRTSQVWAAPLFFRLRKCTADIDLTTSHPGESDD